MPYAEIDLHIHVYSYYWPSHSITNGSVLYEERPPERSRVQKGPDWCFSAWWWCSVSECECLARIGGWHASGYQPSSGEHCCTRANVAELQGIKPGAVPCSQKVILGKHMMFSDVLRALKSVPSIQWEKVTKGLCVRSIPEHRDEWYVVHAEFGLAGNDTVSIYGCKINLCKTSVF